VEVAQGPGLPNRLLRVLMDYTQVWVRVNVGGGGLAGHHPFAWKFGNEFLATFFVL